MAVDQSQHFFQVNESELSVTTVMLRGGWRRPGADASRQGWACQDKDGQDNHVGITNETKHLVFVQLEIVMIDYARYYSISVMKTVTMHCIIIVAFAIVAFVVA